MFEHGKTPACTVSLVSVIFFLLLVNNALYDTGLQLFQPLLVMSVLSLMFIFLFKSQSLRKTTAWGFGILLAFVCFLFFKVPDAFELKRGFLNFSVISTFFLLLNFGHRFRMRYSIAVVCFAIYVFMAVVIVAIGDRGIVNPNWWAMSMFYVFALSPLLRRKKLFILIAVLLALFVYESRGTFVSWMIVLIAYLFGRLDHRIARYGYMLVFIVICFASVWFLELLVQNLDFAILLNSLVGERGLGGRQEAFVQAYNGLKASNYIGNGLSQSTSLLVDEVTNKAISIHFGLLDLAYKFSVLTPVVIVWMILLRVRRAANEGLPFLLGSIGSIFYYNGLGISHFGLNALLMLVLSRALLSHGTRSNDCRSFTDQMFAGFVKRSKIKA